MTLNATTKTVQMVATAVRRQFGDESGVQITDNDLYRWINDGQKEITSKNKVLKGKAAIVAVAGQADYTLPEADIAAIESIHWNGVPLTAISYPELENFIQNYPNLHSSTSGTPATWYEFAGIVTFWPTPAAADAITLLYTKNPPNIAAMADVLSLPDKYFNILLKYVLAQAYEMDEDWEAANFKDQQFNSSLDITADDERTTAGMTYPTISVVVDY